jgi:hypothetical protein
MARCRYACEPSWYRATSHSGHAFHTRHNFVPCVKGSKTAQISVCVTSILAILDSTSSSCRMMVADKTSSASDGAAATPWLCMLLSKRISRKIVVTLCTRIHSFNSISVNVAAPDLQYPSALNTPAW